jgi:prepilin-type processing-associated H-X9-DG protein/prepilin-type N-terminal cleavage/methylation domain-containing protein
MARRFRPFLSTAVAPAPSTGADIRRRPGFTLAELLVVVGIAGALIALVFPMVSAVRRAARGVACTANLRQWATACTAYAAANDRFLPRRGQGQQPTTVIDRPADWFNALPPLLDVRPYRDLVSAGRPPRPGDGSVWACPEAPDVTSGGYLFTYGMNMRLSTWLTPAPDRIDGVGDLGTMVFMADAPSGYCSVLPSADAFSPVARHAGRVNVAFLDGHVASFTGAEAGGGIGDPLRPDVRWVVPGSPWNGPAH